MKRQRVLTISVVVMVLAGAVCAANVEYNQRGRLGLLLGDLNHDGHMDFRDIDLLATVWLEQDCGAGNSCNGADIFDECGDGTVGFKDYSVLAELWGVCTDARQAGCVHAPLTLYEPPPTARADGGTKVYLFSGEFYRLEVDLLIPGRGLDLVWSRTYRSRTGPDTVMGKGWDFSYNIYIAECSGNIILHDGRGRQDIYRPEPSGIWAADGFFRELAQELDGSFTLTFADKGKWQFRALDEPNAPGKISAIIDRNGNSLSFEYDGLGRLVMIHDTLDNAWHSRDVAIAYDANGLIETVTDWKGREVRYSYYNDGDANGSMGDLKSVTSPAVTGTPTGNDFVFGKTTVYAYSTGFGDERLNHNLLTITDPNGDTYLENTYSGNASDPNFDHVVRQILGGPNDIIGITYLQETPDSNNNYAVTKAVTNDRMGNVSAHLFDNRNQAVIVRRYTGRANPDLPTSLDPDVNPPAGKLRDSDPNYFESRYEYNEDYLPTRIDLPNGNYRVNIYDFDLDPNAPRRSRGNLREIHRFAGSLEPVSDQNEIVELFEYDANMGGCCGFSFVTRYVDPKGNETLYDYDPNGNRIRATNVIPGLDPNIVREWEYNGFGQVTGHVLADNGSGLRRRDEYTYYDDPCDPNFGHLKEVTVDANNLALATMYEYDEVGNVTRITDVNGQDTQYIVNQLNQAVRRISREVTDGSGVRYERDIYFDIKDNIVRVDIQNRDDEGSLGANSHFTTTYEYDILGQLTQTTQEVDPCNSIVTEYEYDDNHNLSLIRYGEAVNGNQPNNVTSYVYDERNLLFQVIHAPDDANHSTTQYDYDGNGNLKKTSEGIENSARISTYECDGFGRLVRAIDPMVNGVEYHYDASSNLTSERIEGELIDIVGGNSNVRLYEASYEYDAVNRLRRSVVALFDPNTQTPIGDGNSVSEFKYSLNSQLILVRDDNGNETVYEYDTANRKSLITDAKDNMVSYSYDKNSNVTAITEVEYSDLGEPNESFTTVYRYDNLGRLLRVTDNNSNTTEYGYDSRSNLTRRADVL
ncbi:MAG: RHS repeat domain-containing protein, partial [Planctomycetota bacterium]